MCGPQDPGPHLGASLVPDRVIPVNRIPPELNPDRVSLNRFPPAFASPPVAMLGDVFGMLITL